MQAINHLSDLSNAPNLPPPRNLPQLRSLEGIGEKVRERLRHAGVAAFGLGADGVEVYEPRPEERTPHRLQRIVHPAVQLNLVVQRAEDTTDGMLFRRRWQGDRCVSQDPDGDELCGGSLRLSRKKRLQAMQCVIQETTIEVPRRGCNDVCALACRKLPFEVLEVKPGLSVVSR